MKLALSDLNKKKPPSSNGSDSDYDDREGEFKTVSTEITITETVTSSGNISDISSPSSPLSTAAKRVTEVLDGFTGDLGTPKVINIKDPIDKNVCLVYLKKSFYLISCLFY
jgi:hypothetical protein